MLQLRFRHVLQGLTLIWTNFVFVKADDCKRFCHVDCNQYFSTNSQDFSSCVSAHIECNCGLPWFATLIFVLFGLIFGAVICCGFFRACQTHNSRGIAYGGMNTPVTPTPAALYNVPRNDNIARVHAAAVYPPHNANYNSGFADNSNNVFNVMQQTQPSYNPAFSENPTAPDLNDINLSNGLRASHNDAPPRYDEIVQPNCQMSEMTKY